MDVHSFASFSQSIFVIWLPRDMIIEIFSRLPLHCLAVVACVSRSLFTLLNRDHFWNAWLHRNYGSSLSPIWQSRILQLTQREYEAYDVWDARTLSLPDSSIVRTSRRSKVKYSIKVIELLSRPQVRFFKEKKKNPYFMIRFHLLIHIYAAFVPQPGYAHSIPLRWFVEFISADKGLVNEDLTMHHQLLNTLHRRALLELPVLGFALAEQTLEYVFFAG